MKYLVGNKNDIEVYLIEDYRITLNSKDYSIEGLYNEFLNCDFVFLKNDEKHYIVNSKNLIALVKKGV